MKYYWYEIIGVLKQGHREKTYMGTWKALSAKLARKHAEGMFKAQIFSKEDVELIIHKVNILDGKINPKDQEE